MVSREQRLLVLSALLTSVLLLVAAAAGHAELLAFAAPVLVLALPLLAGRYLGEERIARAAGRRRVVRLRPRRLSRLPRVSRVPRVLVRGGRLIAESLAVRPPPAELVR